MTIDQSFRELKTDRDESLLLAMFFRVRLPSRFSMVSGMDCVSSRGMSMVSSFLMMPAFMMFGGLIVVPSSVGMVL
jgi:hypothetical protein